MYEDDDEAQTFDPHIVDGSKEDEVTDAKIY